MKRNAIGLTIAAAAVVAIFFAVDPFRAKAPNKLDQSAPTTGNAQVPDASVKSDQRSASSRPIAKQPPVSRAPWADFQKKYDEGDFRWLVENARFSPERGSYSYAITALGECARTAGYGSEESQIAALEAANGRDKDLRVAAVHRLFKPCQGLGTPAEIKAQLQALDKDARTAGDKREEMLRTATLRLPDARIPLDQREPVFRQLLELDDPDTAVALKAAMVREGAMLDGKSLTGEERGAFSVAWDMAVCQIYRRCRGPDSYETLLDCAVRGECAFLTTSQAVQGYAPISSSENVARYNTVVLNALQNHSMGPMGLPRSGQ